MSNIDKIAVSGTTYDVLDAKSVHFDSQTLTDAQKAQARANVGAAADDAVADWLYKVIFGDDSDWGWIKTSLGGNQENAYKKVGREISFERVVSNGSTHTWVNLTGTTHRVFQGVDSDGLTNIKTNGNADFVTIPPIFAEQRAVTSARAAARLVLYTTITGTATSNANKHLLMRVLLRRMNADTQEYEYSEFYNLFDWTTTVSKRVLSGSACVFATSTGYQKSDLEKALLEYEEMAIYVKRTGQSIGGEILIEPRVDRVDFDLVETVSSSTPTITAERDGRYICSASAVTELTFTPSASGICSVRFISGSTATVLTLPNTVKMPAWWTGPAANTTYEISIEDGVYGVVTSWT